MGKKKMAEGFKKIKKIANTKVPVPVPPAQEVARRIPLMERSEDSKIENDYAAAVGYLQPFGFPGMNFYPGSFGTPPVEDATMIFDSLRWYLISNLRQVLSQSFAEIGLIQTICMVPVQDALRGGILIKSKQLDEEEIKALSLSVDKDDDLTTVMWAGVWDRLFGGAGIIVLVGDQDPELPLDIEAIGPDTDLDFRDVDMWELFWDKQNTEGYDPEIQEPSFDLYNYYAEQLHRTRVMRLTGLKAPSFIRPRLRGWGLSVAEALVRSINQYLKNTDLGFELLDEAKLDVYKIKNLVNTLVSPTGTEKVKRRVQTMNWTKNYQNALVMDSEDDFDHKQLSFSGLAETMAEIRRQVAADMRMPISKLFGTSENGGMNNTDQNDMENYNSMVEGEVRTKLKYHILTILQLKCQKLFGFVPDDLEIEFKPLREMSGTDQETIKTQKFTRLIQAKAAGEISTLEFRDACNKGHLFDVELDTSEDALSLIEAQKESEASTDPDAAGDDAENDDEESGADKPQSRSLRTPHDKAIAQRQTLNTLTELVKPYKRTQRIDRVLKNSAAFDRASYEADGGDSWIADGRKTLFENPGNVDEALWSKAKEASKAALGSENWKFVTWWYKKQGGKFT